MLEAAWPCAVTTDLPLQTRRVEARGALGRVFLRDEHVQRWQAARPWRPVWELIGRVGDERDRVEEALKRRRYGWYPASAARARVGRPGPGRGLCVRHCISSRLVVLQSCSGFFANHEGVGFGSHKYRGFVDAVLEMSMTNGGNAVPLRRSAPQNFGSGVRGPHISDGTGARGLIIRDKLAEVLTISSFFEWQTSSSIA